MQPDHVVDERHVAEEDLPGPNLMTAVIRLERIGAPSDLIEAVEVLREWLCGPEDDDLRCARWSRYRNVPLRIPTGECRGFPGKGHDAAMAGGSRRACTTNAGTTAYETGGRRLTRPAVGAGYAGLVDENYKKLFAFPRMVEDLLRGFAARGWAGKLEFSTLRKVPAEYVSDALLKRHGDTVWQVRSRDGRHLLVVLEFQSREDPRMALRILVYTSLLYQELFRNEAPVLDAGGRLPAVLPVVVYNGAARWQAAGEVGELVQPVDEELVPYRPSQRYHVLDERHVGEEDLPQPNLVTVVVDWRGSQRRRTLSGWWRCSGSGCAARGTTSCVERLSTGTPDRRAADAGRRASGGGDDIGGREDDLGRAGKRVAEAVGPGRARAGHAGRHRAGRRARHRARIEQGIERGIEQGIEQGRAEERALLCRQAAARFGTDTAERLSGVLAGIADPERLADVGEWLVRCETGEELLVRTESERGNGEKLGG